RLLVEFQPDLVVTDLMMPNGSGMEVLDTVRRFDSNIPVILVTAYGSIESAVEAMKQKAADYLTKPFSMNQLLDKIQESLSRRLIDRGSHEAPSADEESKNWRQGIIGVSAAMERVLELI